MSQISCFVFHLYIFRHTAFNAASRAHFDELAIDSLRRRHTYTARLASLLNSIEAAIAIYYTYNTCASYIRAYASIWYILQMIAAPSSSSSLRISHSRDKITWSCLTICQTIFNWFCKWKCRHFSVYAFLTNLNIINTGQFCYYI